MIFFIVDVGSSLSDVVQSITSSTCVKKDDVGIKTEVRHKLYIKLMFLHVFDENNVLNFYVFDVVITVIYNVMSIEA